MFSARFSGFVAGSVSAALTFTVATSHAEPSVNELWAELQDTKERLNKLSQ